jgi:hypothetical protein
MGFVFLGDNKGGFSFVKPVQSGISSPNDIRKIAVDDNRIIMVDNNAPVRVYKLVGK